MWKKSHEALDAIPDSDQVVMLAVLHLSPDAYGIAIRREIEARTGRLAPLSTIYATLVRPRQLKTIHDVWNTKKATLSTSSIVYPDRSATPRKSGAGAARGKPWLLRSTATANPTRTQPAPARTEVSNVLPAFMSTRFVHAPKTFNARNSRRCSTTAEGLRVKSFRRRERPLGADCTR